jgi:2-polyprenyl-3-methyl-5-hydroxy-6-metoxy-1,4-benzoquinol methylase
MTDHAVALREKQLLLDQVASTYRRQSAQDDAMRRLFVRTIEPWLHNNQAGLEIGCSDGLMTEMLAGRLARLDVVEASEYFIGEMRRRGIRNVAAHHSMVEDYSTDRTFDRIFATWVLTHVADVHAVLGRVRALLSKGGLFFVAVPNVRVLSRQLALHMGLIEDLYALTENDRNHGHARAYDRPRLNRELESAGFEIIEQGGIMLKMLADYQMDELYANGILGDSHIEGLYRLGREYPDLASAIYCVCRVKE